MPKDDITGRFLGFQSPNYTPVPDELFDELAPDLSEAELRVLLYIIRRTFGFKKQSDSISISQMIGGITTRDGRVLDAGTGMSRQGVMRGTKGLLEKGVIEVRKSIGEDGVNQVNLYSLHFSEQGVVYGVDHGSLRSGLGVGNQVDPQETGIQKTVKQNTDLSNIREAPTPNKNGSDEGIPDRTASFSRIRPVTTSGAAGTGDIPQETASSRDQRSGIQSQGDMSRRGGMAAVGDALLRRRRGRPSADEAEMRRVIRQYVEDFGRELGDQAPRSSVTRAINLMREAGVSVSLFIGALQDARKLTQKHSASIQKTNPSAAASSFAQKNKMAYFFSVLEDQLGLREPTPIESASHDGVRRRPPRDR